VIDTYSMKDPTARCADCGSFMPWSRSRQVEVDSGAPAGAPALVEQGVCSKCEANTVTRTRRVEVQRCEAITNPHPFSPPHRCPYAAVVHLDGEWMCQLHADKWARGEGCASRENT